MFKIKRKDFLAIQIGMLIGTVLGTLLFFCFNFYSVNRAIKILNKENEGAYFMLRDHQSASLYLSKVDVAVSSSGGPKAYRDLVEFWLVASGKLSRGPAIYFGQREPLYGEPLPLPRNVKWVDDLLNSEHHSVQILLIQKKLEQVDLLALYKKLDSVSPILTDEDNAALKNLSDDLSLGLALYETTEAGLEKLKELGISKSAYKRINYGDYIDAHLHKN